ncbi:MAG: flagellar M-ring protein FliF [Clostridia bacterium]|nr:flagellar M-ring protein FliF [Clostridia bacterium]
MLDRLRELPQKALEWWNKFNAKQKTIIISVIAGVALTLAILVTILTRPQYETLITCGSTKEASQITELLTGDSIEYNTTDDGLIIYVLKKDLSRATLLLGANNIPADSYSIENALAGGFSATETDKTKRYKLYMESLMETQLKAQEPIDAAYVTFTLPDNDGTLLAKEEEAFASVMLELNTELQPGVAENYAKSIATALGNSTTDNITIIDTAGNLLFSGSDSAENAAGSVNASNQLALKKEAERLVKQEVIQVLLGTNLYEEVKVAPNLIMDFSATDHTNHNYTPADGQSQGVLSHENTYESESTGGTGGVPGTDTNTEENTYVIEDNATTSSTVVEESRDYLPNEEIISTQIPPGSIQYDESSIAVTASHYVIYKETELRAQGLLDGISFDEFVAANSEKVKLTVDAEMLALVSNATGIPVERISMVAYNVPIFQEKEDGAVSAQDILPIILIILILGLLGFVIFSGMKKEKAEEEPQEELSVESLLASTQEHSAIEDIDLDAKSETRVMIEKFVDDNPEAAAALLRNWLNDEWGA